MRTIVVAALLLTGCWTGDSLFADGDAMPVFEEGSYIATDDQGRQTQLTITSLPSGFARISESDGSSELGLAPLDTRGDSFVLWDRPPPGSSGGGRSEPYLLVLRSRPGTYLVYMPVCDGRQGRIAASHGAQIIRHGIGAAECRFSSRESLEASLRAIRPELRSPLMIMVRIP